MMVTKENELPINSKKFAAILLYFLLLNCSESFVFICTASENTPSIFVQQSIFEFQTVAAGQMIVHDFIVENKGEAPLIIEEVEPDCGCTTAFFTKQILPHASGRISVRLNTANYGGNFVIKSVEVFSNDPETPVIDLVIKGKVDRFIAEPEPLFVCLKGVNGEKMESEVTLTTMENYPFKIVGLETENKGNVSVVLKRYSEKDDPLQYILKLETLRNSPGRYRDLITVKTDNPIRPEIKIFFYAEICTDK